MMVMNICDFVNYGFDFNCVVIEFVCNMKIWFDVF